MWSEAVVASAESRCPQLVPEHLPLHQPVGEIRLRLDYSDDTDPRAPSMSRLPGVLPEVSCGRSAVGRGRAVCSQEGALGSPERSPFVLEETHGCRPACRGLSTEPPVLPARLGPAPRAGGQGRTRRPQALTQEPASRHQPGPWLQTWPWDHRPKWDFISGPSLPIPVFPHPGPWKFPTSSPPQQSQAPMLVAWAGRGLKEFMPVYCLIEGKSPGGNNLTGI